MNLLYRYITQGRVESDRPHLSPRRVARLVLTRPEALSDAQQATDLAQLVRSFAALLRPDPVNEIRLRDWTSAAKACDLPNIHRFTRGLDMDIDAAIAAVTLPFHNGLTESVNTINEDDQETDIRPCRIHPTPPPHPARLTPRTVTTESATEPFV